jgi:hypothetical protein
MEQKRFRIVRDSVNWQYRYNNGQLEVRSPFSETYDLDEWVPAAEEIEFYDAVASLKNTPYES